MRWVAVALVFATVVGAALIGAARYQQLEINRQVAAEIEQLGELVSGQPVSVQSTSIDRSRGRATVVGLRIDNPPGYDSPHALYIRSISLAFEAGDPLRLRELHLQGAELHFETDGRISNTERLLDHLSLTPRPDSPTERRVLLDTPVVVDGWIAVWMQHRDDPRLADFPDPVLERIGRAPEGTAVTPAARLLLDTLLRTGLGGAMELTLRELTDQGQADMQQDLGKPGEDAAEYLRGRFGIPSATE